MPAFVVFERTDDGWDPLTVLEAVHARQARRLAEAWFPGSRLRALEVHKVEAGDVLRAQYRGRVRHVSATRRADKGHRGLWGTVKRVLGRRRR